MAASNSVWSQQKYFSSFVQDTIPINFDNKYFISQVNIIPQTEKIILRGNILSNQDYSFQYSKGFFQLSDSLPYSIFDTLIVSYQTIKISLQKEYKRRSLILRVDTETGDSLLISKLDSGIFSTESIFGSSMEKSGTIVRGFTVGTTKDFTLNSGLRLQLAGKLSDDIEIVAALTDENTPIQPEGNTERLEELDKVFIQIKHKNAIGTFGDYELNKKFGEFGVINRKLQGLIGEFFYEGQKGYLGIASSKGKFNSNNLLGIDGVQGPYRLSGINSEPDIIIIAGSERVYLDGIELVRGEGNDYTIDYSNASVTFTPKKLITSASRINIDFEYTDRRYARNVFGAGAEGLLFEDKMSVKFQYLREGDDQDAPIDIILSDSDKENLKNAGDDRNKAVKSGVSLAAPDSLGNIHGTYFKVDTLISNQQFSYYVYLPGDSASVYNVSFSFVGEGKGDYIRETLGNYRFVGIGMGTYLPISFLPLPELKQIANLVFDITPWKDVSLSLEYAGSLWDKNRLSDLDKGDDYGYARNIFLKINPQEINLGSISLGKAGVSYKDRFVLSRFTSPDRFNEVEFNRNYNLSSLSEPQNESLRELSLQLIPTEQLFINTSIGILKQGDVFSSDRYNNILKFTDNTSYNIDYNFDYVKSVSKLLTSKWLRQKGDAYYTFWQLKPGVEFLSENKNDKFISNDSLSSSSLKYYEVNPYLQLIEYEGLKLSVKYSLRQDYFPINGKLVRESDSRAQFYEMSYSGIREVNSLFSFTYRKKQYSDEFKLKGLLDNETILIRTQNKFIPIEKILNGDLFYEVSTQKSAKIERIFVRVEKGTGSYRYLGDINNNGIADENEFEPTLFDGEYILVNIPTDELFPVINLKTSTRWKLNFADMFNDKSIAGKLFSPLSTESYWRVEENTTEEDYKKIYLLNFSAFQNEEKTITGSNLFQQDIFLFENKQDFSLRFRYSEKNTLNQFSGGVERAYNRERSLRITFKMIEEVSNQTEISTINDNVRAPESSNRKRLVTNNSVSTDFSYRPERNIEIGFKLKIGRSEDDLPENPTIIDLNSQLIRLNISFSGLGRLRVEIQRDELNANSSENFIPFELTGGNALGKNYFWRLNFDYRISTYLQSTLSYDGRVQGGGKVVHTARAEVRAYF